MSTITSLKEALMYPFAPECIQFLPRDIHQENGRSVCLALPYANKRVYEDRLNELVFGEWSTPFTLPYAHDNKLIIPATVVILGVAHTDYGEAFMTATGKNGTTREDENTATEAYSQAFRRACAKFLLGRYLYDLSTLTLPYDPKTRRIAVSRAERIAWVEKLYIQQGLLPKVHPIVSLQAVVSSSTTARQEAPAPRAVNVASEIQQDTTPPSNESKQPTQLTSYPNDTFLDWVAQYVERDPVRLEGICTYYDVQHLAQLSTIQREKLTRQLKRQARSSSPIPLQANPS